MHHFIFPHEVATHHKQAHDSHMISSVSSNVASSSPALSFQLRAKTPEVSNIKAFATATSSFDVWVIEDKLTG